MSRHADLPELPDENGELFPAVLLDLTTARMLDYVWNNVSPDKQAEYATYGLGGAVEVGLATLRPSQRHAALGEYLLRRWLRVTGFVVWRSCLQRIQEEYIRCVKVYTIESTNRLISHSMPPETMHLKHQTFQQRTLFRFLSRISGGKIHTEKQAHHVLLIFIALALILSFVILKTARPQHTPDEYGIESHL